jgi:hypothetical protein
MSEVIHRTRAELDAALDSLRASPRDAGTVALIVARPGVDERQPVEAVELAPNRPLPGDRWAAKPSVGAEPPKRQLTVMNVRVTGLVAGPRERWPLTGDNLLVDFDLSEDRLPAGTRLRVGTAVLEISPERHAGCSKFAARFGKEALAFVNSPEGRRLRLRGLLAHVVEAGTVRVGDPIGLA